MEVGKTIGKPASISLEVCIDSFASAAAARDGGADRLEVCASLATGGTTPSFGLVQQCVEELGVPVMMMIRPHDGAFIYNDDDVDTMRRDIAAARKLNVQGIVLGALNGNAEVDINVCRRLLDAAGDLQTTFHRAFDMVADPSAALDQIEQLGFERILTSGQQAHAIDGAELLSQLVQQANSISILAGSGVNSNNVAQLIRATGVHEVHASGSVAAAAIESATLVSFGDARRVTCAAKVSQIRQAIDTL